MDSRTSAAGYNSEHSSIHQHVPYIHLEGNRRLLCWEDVVTFFTDDAMVRKLVIGREPSCGLQEQAARLTKTRRAEACSYQGERCGSGCQQGPFSANSGPKCSRQHKSVGSSAYLERVDALAVSVRVVHQMHPGRGIWQTRWQSDNPKNL